jgi:signal transduction histidine kinase/CheY-like chemotaxis protein
MADNEFNELEIVNQISVGLIGIDADKNVFLWNVWMEQNSALHSKEVIGQTLNDIYPDAYKGRLLQAVEQAFSQRMPSVLSNVFNRSVFPLYNSSQKLIQQSISVFPITFKNKNCCIIQITDVSAAVAREQALERQVIERKKAEQAKSEFLASMSHEIRTPLNGVLGMLDLLKRDNLPAKTQEFVNVAYTSANALLFIVNDVLDFSKIEAGKLDIEQTPFNIVEFLEEVVQFFALMAQEKNIGLNLDTTELNISLVIGDPNRIKQILMNLISNALKFTEVGEVTVKAKMLPIDEQQAQLVCQVHDSGIGINEMHQSALFSPFKQADTSIALKYGGTGLGLSIAKQLCNLMGGEIEVKSRIGEGSCFNFDIILAYRQEVIIEPLLKDKNAIIIGLNDTSSDILKSYLQYEGAQVFASTIDFDAFTLLKTKKNIDLLFLDYNFYEQHLSLVVKFLKENKQKIEPILITPSYSETKGVDIFHTICQPIFRTKLIELIQHKLVNTTDNKLDGFPEDELSILVVEDNPINQIVIKEILKKLGFECKIAKDGLDAIDILQKSKNDLFDIIFMDCKMPRLDGFETTEQIRQGKAGEAYQNVEIVALTANAVHTEKDRCLECGMNDFLTKPIDVEKLSETLHASSKAKK